MSYIPCDWTCACSVYSTGICGCHPATTVDALVARADRDAPTNHLLWAKFLYDTGRVNEWGLLWQRP